MIPEILQEHLDNNSWEEAISYINNLTCPLNNDLLEKLVWCYSRAGKYQESIEKCDELIQRQPNKAKWYYIKGYQFYMQKQWQMAVDNFVKALDLYEDYFVVKYRLAYAYLQIAGTDKQWSKDVFWKAIKQLEGCHNIYSSFNSEEQRKNASTYADICALHGKTIMSSEKHINRSIELLQTAVSLQNDNVDFKYQLAKAYYNQKDYDKAISILPNSDKPYYLPELKSLILTEKGNISEANKILLNLVHYRQKDYLFQRLAENYLLLREIDKADEFAKKAIQTGHHNYKNQLLYAKILKEKQQYKAAITYFQKARDFKQKQFNADCSEAIQMIDEILQQTDGEPYDLEIITIKENSNCKKGKIIKYNSEKGYGFIKTLDNLEDYFFHISNCPKGFLPEVGMKIVFNVERTDRGLQAIDISLDRIQ